MILVDVTHKKINDSIQVTSKKGCLFLLITPEKKHSENIQQNWTGMYPLHPRSKKDRKQAQGTDGVPPPLRN